MTTSWLSHWSCSLFTLRTVRQINASTSWLIQLHLFCPCQAHTHFLRCVTPTALAFTCLQFPNYSQYFNLSPLLPDSFTRVLCCPLSYLWVYFLLVVTIVSLKSLRCTTCPPVCLQVSPSACVPYTEVRRFVSFCGGSQHCLSPVLSQRMEMWISKTKLQQMVCWTAHFTENTMDYIRIWISFIVSILGTMKSLCGFAPE